MNLYCLKWLQFKNICDVKITSKTNGKINLDFHCINHGFIILETIDEVKIKNLLKS